MVKERKSEDKLLEIADLSVTFLQYERGCRQIQLPVIRGLSVSLAPGEVVAVVGSSGSGKSLLAHAILGILPANASVSGIIKYCGEDLNEKRLRSLRGKEIVLMPQSVSYLDPLMKIGPQVRKGKKDSFTLREQREVFQRHGLGLEVENLYPFELSGGMARRVLVSSTVMGEPKLIIADEPTPGLHLSAAKKILAHFREIADRGSGVLLITHDVELAFSVADKVVVFYAGLTVEEALVSDFQREETLRHPYTKALFRALPQNGFQSTPGVQPYVKDLPEGCPYGPRCPLYTEECGGEIPLRSFKGGAVRCAHAGEGV